MSDYNTIPTAIIERIEILKDGASAVYGSDAIGGVVNIITRKDYEGVGLSYHSGMFIKESDGENQQAQISWGAVRPGTSMFLNLSYTNLDRTPTTNRWFTGTSIPLAGVTRWSGTTERGRFEFIPSQANGSFYQCPNIGSGVAAGFVDDPAARGLVQSSSVAPAGIQLCDIVLNKDSVDKQGPGSTALSDYHSRTYDDAFNKLLNGSLTEPNQRSALFAQFTQDLSEHLSFTFEGLYNIRKSRTVSFNIAFAGGDLLGGQGWRSGVPQENQFNPFGQDIGIETDCDESVPTEDNTCVGLTQGVGDRKSVV